MAVSGGAPAEALLECPWLPVCIGGCQLLAKTWFGETAYHILLTDLQCAWEERMDRAAIQSRAQELNRRLRAPVQAFFSHLCEVARPCLSGPGQPEGEGGAGEAHMDLTHQGDGSVNMRLKSELAGLPFYWEFHCSPAPATMVCSQLVRPLLLMSRLLQRQAEQLGGLLVRKDTEIQDYRENGATLSRERLQTEVFEEQSHRETFVTQTLPQLCAGHQEGLGFNSDLQDLYTAVVTHGNTRKRKLSERHTPEEDEPTDQSAETDHAPNHTPPPDEGSVCTEPGEGDGGHSQNDRGHRAGAKMADTPREQQGVPAPTERLPSRPKKKKAVGLFR